jgi:heat shock protein HslJ
MRDSFRIFIVTPHFGAMEKILLLLFSLIFSVQIMAQDPDPGLFSTWYLYEVQGSDLDLLSVVAKIHPPINPSITISELLEFNGVGACNTFSGTYSHQGNELSSVNFTNTNDDCGVLVHNSFENYFFSFMHYFWHEITPDSSGLSLYLENVIFGHAILKNYPLSINDNNFQNNITLFPNPVSNTLFISSENTPIEKIKVYSISGKQRMEGSMIETFVDGSSLSEGLYFLEIFSSEGKSI